MAEKSSSKKPSTRKHYSKKDFLVVGLGASAGGVRALQEFFATMPANSGMAFVVILHLSPEHESNLAQILQAQTLMKVTQVTKTVKVEPNKVYVIPPNQQLEMIDGVIRPAEVKRPLGHRITIDIFFRTLATAYERNAICIVLSGMGSDGTLGLKRIKESNGFAIVQDPEDAEYDSMPRSAINTQLADWILPVHRMPEKLIGFRESSERLHLTDGDAKKVADEINADESLREILTLLRVRTGHDFSNYKMPTLVRRIARHLQIHELEDIPSYLELLRQQPNEIQSLLKNLLINVTNFFRDKDAFEALEAEVIPNIFAGKTGKDMVRVWSAGCASGEEAYSLAMLLTEYADLISDPPKIQVFASDVDDEAIAEAREHRYPESIETDIAPERLKRFFTKEGSFYRIKKELREAVLFAPHNILRDPPFSRLDLISCRNLLIYLNRETQERVLQIFHFALNTQGYLFLGSSETAENAAAMFAPVDKKNRIYSRRVAPASMQNSLPVMPVIGRWEVRVPERKTEIARDRAATLGEIHYRLLENYAPSSVLVNQDFDIVYLSGTADKFLRFAGGEPSRNLLKAIIPDLLPDLRAALFTAQREHKSSEFSNVRVRINGEDTTINLIVRAVDVEDQASDFLLVIFEERNASSVVEKVDEEVRQISGKDEAMETVVRRLEEDLQRTKEHLRFTIEQHETAIEELKASNEELQAINEELRSASEELETSKEELQSVNEELTTVNHELKDKIDETGRVNSDLQNLIAATDIATIFLDKNLKIKRYTPTVTEIFNIIPTDIGRPLSHVTHRLAPDDFQKDAVESLQKLKSFEREIRSLGDNRFFIVRFAPYRTLEDKIEGVIISFIDITEREETQQLLKEERIYAQAIVETVREPLIILDKDLRVASASRSFYETFKVVPGETEGNFIYDLGNGQWNIPDLRELLENILPERSQFQDFEVEHEFETIGRRTMLLNAREIRREGEGRRLILLAFSDISERIQAELMVRESEEKLRTLFDSIDEGFCIIEVIFDKKSEPVDYRFLDVNPAFARQTGIENAVGRRMLEIVPENENFWFEIYGSIAKTGEAKRFEHEAAALGKFYDVYAFRVGAAGKNRVAVLFKDILERKQAEKAIRFQAQLLNTVEQSVIATDLEGNIIFWNDFAEKLFGWTAAEALGQNILEVTTPQISQTKAKEIMVRLQGGESWHGEFFVQRRDGTTFPAQVFNSPIYDEQKSLIGIIGVSVDITERRQIEEVVRKSEEHLNLILESTKDYAIITFDLEGRITHWNTGAEIIFGYAEDEMVGKDGAILFTPEDRASKVPEKEMETALKKGRAEDERWHLRKDGSRFFASGVMQPLKDGEVEGFVKIARDQTERLKAETALREQEMLRQFVRTQEDERRRIARDLHDHLGQQMTAMRLKLESLKKEVRNEPVYAELDEVQSLAEQLDRDVDFLAWELRPAALDDLGLRITLANFVGHWSDYTGVKAEFHLGGLGKNRLDVEIETNLYRIAQEALNNIYKHAKAQSVSVLLEKSGKIVSLIVEDDGIGFNVKTKANRQKGLGLTGMRERARICGGELEIESAKGKGTTIFARVPVRK